MKKLVPLAVVGGWLVFGDWLAGLSLGLLALIWVLLPAEEGPPVLALAVSMQWVEVCLGYFYYVITGRPLDATLNADYRTMVLLGLGCVLALVLGLAVARALLNRLRPAQGLRPEHALAFRTLLLVYVVATPFIGVLQQIAFDYGGLAQAIISLTYLRLGVLYLIFRRLVARNQWYYMLPLLGLEVVLGITGFYAGFREPIMMAALAFLEVFDRRNVRHWVSVGTLTIAATTLGVIWIGIRADYRARYVTDDAFATSRSQRIDALKTSVNAWMAQSSRELWDNIDNFVDRMWPIYYPALAVERVPSVLPHTNGTLMADTLRFVFEPRLFFPDKPEVMSDSQMVRKYAGVMVAGDEVNTDIAFGYAAESYIDYGVPGMFVPSFVWGLFIGVACGLVLREYRHRDLAVSMVTVIAWMTLYLFERSWTKTIGLGGTLLIYGGGLCYILDRLWFEKFKSLYIADTDDDTADVGPFELQPHSK